jgi:hypothetical protein
MGLKALINIKINSDLKTKIIRWLLQQRSGSEWHNTQETALIVYALVDYLRNSNELDPDYTVHIYLNGERIYDKNIVKEDINQKDSTIIINSSLLKKGRNELRIEKVGTGNVYLSANMSYNIDDPDLKSQDNGFKIEREYFLLKKFDTDTLTSQGTGSDAFMEKTIKQKISNRILSDSGRKIKNSKDSHLNMPVDTTTVFIKVDTTNPLYLSHYPDTLKNENDLINFTKNNFFGTVKSGDIILVKLRVSAKENNLNYFMIEDPLPAGCEVLKDNLPYKIIGEDYYTGYYEDYWRWWYADREVRDNRVTFFATKLTNSIYEFSYLLRAEIPGNYYVKPTLGMLMYYNEFNGSSDPIKLNIED